MRTMPLKFARGVFLMALMFGPRAALAMAPGSPATAFNFTLADLGVADITIRAVFDQALVRFPLPAGVSIRQGTLHLHLAHDPALLPALSDLTVSLNNEPVANLPLTSDNAAQTEVDLALPVAALRSGDNELRFRFKLRLFDTGCAERNNPRLWAQVLANTALDLAGIDTPLTPNLAEFPAPFTTVSALGGPAVLLVLAPQPAAAELSAAAQSAAALGRAAHWQNPPLQSLTLDHLTDAQAAAAHLIVIDQAGRNRLAQGAAPGVTESVSPYNPNRLLLVVSGADAAGLARSAALLSTQSSQPLLSGTHVDPVEVAVQAPVESPTRATLAELGDPTPQLRGLGVHDLYYPMDVPYDWKLTEDARVELYFTHAHGLSSANSRLKIFVNGFLAAQSSLDHQNDSAGHLSISLSPRKMHPGRNWLHLAFDLHVPKEDCQYRYLEEAWAAVLPTSLINLAHVASTPPIDTHFLPSAFVLPEDLSGNVFVLPDQPTTADLTAMVKLAAKLGTYTATADGLRPQALTAGAAVPKGLNAILIGPPERHSLLASADPLLPQPLTRRNGAIQPAGGRALLPGEAENLAGYLEILPAVDGSGSAWLVVAGYTDPALALAVGAMPTFGQRLKASGNVAVARQGQIDGLTIGQLAGAPLSVQARGGLAAILLGVTVTITGLGIYAARRRGRQAQESKNATE